MALRLPRPAGDGFRFLNPETVPRRRGGDLPGGTPHHPHGDRRFRQSTGPARPEPSYRMSSHPGSEDRAVLLGSVRGGTAGDPWWIADGSRDGAGTDRRCETRYAPPNGGFRRVGDGG